MAARGVGAPLTPGATSISTPEHVPPDVVGLAFATACSGAGVVGWAAPPWLTACCEPQAAISSVTSNAGRPTPRERFMGVRRTRLPLGSDRSHSVRYRAHCRIVRRECDTDRHISAGGQPSTLRKNVPDDEYPIAS